MFNVIILQCNSSLAILSASKRALLAYPFPRLLMRTYRDVKVLMQASVLSSCVFTKLCPLTSCLCRGQPTFYHPNNLSSPKLRARYSLVRWIYQKQCFRRAYQNAPPEGSRGHWTVSPLGACRPHPDTRRSVAHFPQEPSCRYRRRSRTSAAKSRYIYSANTDLAMQGMNSFDLRGKANGSE